MVKLSNPALRLMIGAAVFAGIALSGIAPPGT